MGVWERIVEILNVRGHVGGLLRLLDPDHWLPGGKDAAFTVALVALVAKMAVADGVVSASEVRAFRTLVQVAPAAETQVERFFELAQQDVAGFEAYAHKVKRMFEDSPETLDHVFDLLFTIAAADGFIHENEQICLQQVCDIFELPEGHFRQIAAQHMVADDGLDPYLVLGLTPDASSEQVKSTYRRLVKEHHPDQLIARGVPAELVSMATARISAINAAYDLIAPSRGL